MKTLRNIVCLTTLALFTAIEPASALQTLPCPTGVVIQPFQHINNQPKQTMSPNRQSFSVRNGRASMGTQAGRQGLRCTYDSPGITVLAFKGSVAGACPTINITSDVTSNLDWKGLASVNGVRGTKILGGQAGRDCDYRFKVSKVTIDNSNRSRTFTCVDRGIFSDVCVAVIR